MKSCTYGIWNEDAYQLYLDVDTLDKLLGTLDGTLLRSAKIADALEEFTLIVDFEQEREERIQSYRKARLALKPALEAVNGSTMPLFYAIGNAHLDLAWLWPMAETYRKTARTFAAQLRLIEEYPEYKFLQSQPALYEMCRKYYPELFERIKEAVRGGQWIAEGAMWVEPDTNMAGGEALIRQLVHGKRYYKEEFGVESRVLWLPDTFGYSAALPQILKGCGVKYLVTQKIFWSYNGGETFPYHYFTWEGMDGSDITAFLPTSYTYRTDPEEIARTWKGRTQARDLDAFLLPFGYGDGGGGPSRDYIEYARRQKDLEGAAKVKIADPVEFFEDMEAKGGPSNKYTGELYFNAHRGTYTSQAKIKENNRNCEIALREMEFWGSLAGWKTDYVYDLSRADALWKELLLNQFHDILPGSSIARVYHESEKAVGEVIREATERALEAAQSLVEENMGANFRLSDSESADSLGEEKLGKEGLGKENAGAQMTVLNSLSFEREALVKVPDNFACGAKTRDGETVPVGRTPEGVKALVKIPSCGAVTLLPADSMADSMGDSGCGVSGLPEEKRAVILETEEGYVIENGRIRACINRMGEVYSYILKASDREFAAKPMNRFHFYKDVPRLFDAWDIDSCYLEQEIAAARDVKTEKLCDGIEAVLKVTGLIGNSSYTQCIRLAADSSTIVFETAIDWHELHRLLKTAFPVDVYAVNGVNEIQFGYVERPVHRSKLYDKDRFEVCNHRYSALFDHAHGAAVLNNCKYGISMNGNSLELTLLRAAAAPEMRADNRMHHFTYAFTAWEGDFAACDVVRQGYELNVKPLTVNGGTDSFSILSIERDNVFLDTMKPAEDGGGDVILRLYEAKRAAVTTKITVGFGKKAYLCDMLENISEEIPMKDGQIELDFRAFEIKTVRICRE